MVKTEQMEQTEPQGPIGLTGPQGLPGNDGADGQDGADGAQGPIGLTGPQGPPGNDGADGQDGADGAQGPIGLTGPQGPPGNDGIDGQDGADGAQGPIGLTGPQGLPGNDGADGQDGADGAQGPIGLTGPQGLPGNDGIDGQDGADGADGAQGPIGLTGPQGPPGNDGIDGGDDQDISGSSLVGTSLTIGIQNGSSETIDLSSLQDGVDDADNDPTNEFNSSIVLNGSDLEITDGGGTITTNIDDQDWTKSGIDMYSHSSVTGNIGIGTTGPDSKLHVEGNLRVTSGGDAFEKLIFDYRSGGYSYLELKDATSNSDFLFDTQRESYLNGEGYLGIFTTSPIYKFHLYNNTDFGATSIGESTNDAINGVAFSSYNTSASNGFSAFEGVTDGTGVGVYGLHTPASGNGVGVMGATDSTAAAWAAIFMGDVGLTGGLFNISDRRFKKNINDFDDVLSKVMQLKPKTYVYDTDQFPVLGDENKVQYGFIAQEVNLLFPEIVSNQKEIPNPKNEIGAKSKVDFSNGYYLMDYTSLIPVLTKAIQQQQLQIERQQEQIDELIKIINDK